MRDRLIELLNKKYDHFCDQCGVNKDSHYTDSLADYLLANGVIVPPCKVGTTIYMIVEKRAKVTREYFRFIKTTKLTFLNLERVMNDFGKTVFLTREEAEAKLKERKEDEGK